MSLYLPQTFFFSLSTPAKSSTSLASPIQKLLYFFSFEMFLQSLKCLSKFNCKLCGAIDTLTASHFQIWFLTAEMGKKKKEIKKPAAFFPLSHRQPLALDSSGRTKKSESPWSSLGSGHKLEILVQLQTALLICKAVWIPLCPHGNTVPALQICND